MRQSRKEDLLWSFPDVPSEFVRQMQDGRSSANFAVLLTYGKELFVRCFHRYGKSYRYAVCEVQRYVFAKDGSVRYGADDCGRWKVRRDFREPIFYYQPYGYADTSYRVLNIDAITKSDMKYCRFEDAPDLLMEYLHLYCKHPNVEYLLESGYKHLVRTVCTGWWGQRNMLKCSSLINWKSNNLLKMLGLSRTEFKLLNGREKLYEAYIAWRDAFPGINPEGLLAITEQFPHESSDLQSFCKLTGFMPDRIARYLQDNHITSHDYRDYLADCQKLQYDLHDTAISMPHDFMVMHTRVSSLIEYKENNAVHRQFMKHKADREWLAFASGGIFIRQPDSISEIVAEGRHLHHCVGGYAERHAKGALHIMFIRRADKPDVPFYTVEVDLLGEIVQVRGLRNCKTTAEVDAFMDAYKDYLAEVFGKKQKVRITA